MIVVIADDLSGAAELAGVAHTLGYSAEVQTRFLADVASQVVCVDANGRGVSPAEAAETMEGLIPNVVAARPELIYLKFDSVLRGNVLAEILAAMRATGVQSILLVTANPGRGRIIRDGNYYIDGVPLHRTAFASDPEHPRATSSVRELLGQPGDGIVTPDVESPADLARLAETVGHDFLVAGAAEFFEALLLARAARSLANEAGRPFQDLEHRNPQESPRFALESLSGSPAREKSTTLLVCGSKSSWRARCEEASARGVPAFDIGDDPALISRSLSQGGAAVLVIGDRWEMESSSAPEPLAVLAEITSKVVGWARPGRLLLEGGATAAAVVRRLGWTRLLTLDGVGGGVGRLRPIAPEGPVVLIIPGSYPWPDGVWEHGPSSGERRRRVVDLGQWLQL
jgi:uncharacterized protein YgbK (DUF1537 family)